MTAAAPLAVTMGEPAGVGPEQIARLWQERIDRSLPPFLVFGAEATFKAVAPDLPIQIVSDPAAAISAFKEALPLYVVGDCPQVEPGTLKDGTQQATIAALDESVRFALKGDVSGVVTAPIQKSHLMTIGFEGPGHTEYLARLCGLPADASVMMLATEELRVVPATVHIPLKDVPNALTHDMLVETVLKTYQDLKTRFGIETPRLVMAGLNPHAGEEGLLGIEEGTHILPALMTLKDDYGIMVSGPAPGDTLFHAEARASYDAVICMYHDQALIPLKTLDFWGGVNVTLGLPIIRTSPDHGTALSLAGSGRARLDSFHNALMMAWDMANRSNADQGS